MKRGYSHNEKMLTEARDLARDLHRRGEYLASATVDRLCSEIENLEATERALREHVDPVAAVRRLQAMFPGELNPKGETTQEFMDRVRERD